MTRIRVKSFQFRVTLAFVLSMLFIAALSNFLIYQFALNAQFEQLRDKLKVIAQTASLSIDTALLSRIPLTKEGINSPEHQTVVTHLRKIRDYNPPIYSIYIMAKTDRPGILKFIADADIPNEDEIKKGITFYPGDTYDASRFPEMLAAFQGATADKKISRDEWGVVLSGYAPIRDARGGVFALLGVDIFAEDVYRTQRAVHIRAFLVFALGLLLSIFVGVYVSARISEPVKKLIRATGHIAKGDLGYKVDLKGEDELMALARSFNKMGLQLIASQRKLHAYFYNVMQSMVLMLEAKDKYTEGHSKRVAEFACLVAEKLHFSPDKVELLRETALLHDIGKIGVHESILNKKEALTQEEWEVIRKHPQMGEEILKPVTLSAEMLQVVRNHHERLDGKGYPDSLKGGEINIFVSIISVADAYDAMISRRAYRKALSKEEAIEELKRNRNTQFNPDVVDAFVEVLENEGP